MYTTFLWSNCSLHCYSLPYAELYLINVYLWYTNISQICSEKKKQIIVTSHYENTQREFVWKRYMGTSFIVVINISCIQTMYNSWSDFYLNSNFIIIQHHRTYCMLGSRNAALHEFTNIERDMPRNVSEHTLLAQSV